VAVGSKLPNSTYGQSVSFTVTVSGPSGAPTPHGTVQFVVDGSDLGSPVTLSKGSATSSSTTLLGAGSRNVVADYSGDSNYASNSGSYTQVVNKAPLSIVPNNLSRPVGQPNPPFTYTFAGFVNGENANSANITGAVNLSTTATITSPAGRYPITVTNAGTLAAPNYNFPSADFKTGTLTVKGRSKGAAVPVVPPVTRSGGSTTSPSRKHLRAGSRKVDRHHSGDSHRGVAPAHTHHHAAFANGNDATNSGMAASASPSITASSSSSAVYYAIAPTAKSIIAAHEVLSGRAHPTRGVAAFLGGSTRTRLGQRRPTHPRIEPEL
jgi:hypothetical protein